MSTFFTRNLLDDLVAEARAVPRQRKNRNFHPDNAHPAHRLLNAIEPGSYVTPHRHLDGLKDETMVCVAGALGVVLFDEAGQVTAAQVLTPGGETFGVDIAHGTFHSVLGLVPGTVFLEAKAGPYQPFQAGEVAPWAPAEGDGEAPGYYQSLQALFPPQ